MPDHPDQPAAYDAIAGWYDTYLRERPLYRELLLPTLLDLAGDVRDAHVCDLACGQGFVARALAERGAHVTGLDISAHLLALAQGYEEERPLGIHYLLDDAQTAASLADGAFDGVACSMALMPIPDLGAAYATVRRLVRPGGWFVLAITHPCFQTPRSRWITLGDGTPAREVSAYFDERFWTSANSAGVRGQVGEHHRTLSTYLNTLTEHGLVFERMAEPPAPPDAASEPGNREVPSLLLVRARRG